MRGKCHDPRDRDNNFSLSQVYSIFFDYMRCDIFSKSLILHNYTLFFRCYDHVTCNRVCFVTWWMTDCSHMILLLGMYKHSYRRIYIQGKFMALQPELDLLSSYPIPPTLQ
jgi:hypothetical protein